RKSFKDIFSNYMVESAERGKESATIIEEARASTNATLQKQGNDIKAIEMQLEEIATILQERMLEVLPKLDQVNKENRNNDELVNTHLLLFMLLNLLWKQDLQILDGPFILNELLHWCKRKKKQVMFFKVDFAKAYDSVRWDYLLDVLEAFGFGNIWCKWIRGTFSSAKASVLVNGSPTIEFSFHCGLKQGDPLSPYLFILIMESLNMSFTRAIDEGVFKGVHLHELTSISHLFYANDVMFIGEWSDDNLKGGRLTILKAVLGASPLYNMSIFKVPKGILNSMEAIQSTIY
nr:RNA-directed DNA polymerase, eukaryota [Tanacetum cinerariifolium]